MILVDANLLIYAIDSDAPLHRSAREWLEEVLSGTTRVGLPWVVLLAFVRITTRRGILVRPLSLDEALTTWIPGSSSPSSSRSRQAPPTGESFAVSWRPAAPEAT